MIRLYLPLNQSDIRPANSATNKETSDIGTRVRPVFSVQTGSGADGFSWPACLNRASSAGCLRLRALPSEHGWLPPDPRRSVSTLLDAVLPEYQFSERHRIRVDASPEVALAAAREVSLGEMPLERLLFRIRGMRTPARGRLWEQMLAGGFVDLGAVPGREVVGGVGPAGIHALLARRSTGQQHHPPSLAAGGQEARGSPVISSTPVGTLPLVRPG